MSDLHTTAQRPLDSATLERLASQFERAAPQLLLEWAIGYFGERLTFVTSFQAEGMAILDMAWRINPAIRVVTVDTGRLHAETHALIDQVRERYGLAIEVFYPDAVELETFTRDNGLNPFYRSVSARFACCDIRKARPLDRALDRSAAWLTGQRRGQAATRRRVAPIERDALRGNLVKLNPLANWTGAQVWSYLRANDVPMSDLYRQGYTSIGCVPCTRPIAPGEDERAGRWWWEEGLPKECGIHLALVPPPELLSAAGQCG